MHSVIHEARLTALLIWLEKFKKGDQKIRTIIYDLYLKNTEWINNWDLVGVSARDIVGFFAYNNDSSILGILSKRNNVWERRIAVIATSYFIQREQYDQTLQIAIRYPEDTHHYIHKALGGCCERSAKKMRQY